MAKRMDEYLLFAPLDLHSILSTTSMFQKVVQDGLDKQTPGCLLSG